MKHSFIFSVVAMTVSLSSFANLSSGTELDPDKALHDWQVRRLMQPSQRELEKEEKGSVYVYDGLREQEVDAALNTHFSRIQNMMFVGTVKTDTSGEPLQDAASGQVIQESGGCGE